MSLLILKPYKTGSSLEQRKQSPPASSSPLSGCRRFFLHPVNSLKLLACFWLLLAPATAHAEEFRLTAEGLDAYEQATEIFYAYAVTHPDTVLDTDSETLNQITAEEFRQRIAANAPELLHALESNGILLAEYHAFSRTLAGYASWLALIEQAGLDASQLAGIERANLEFVRAHRERFMQFHERMKQKYGAMSTTEAPVHQH